MPDPAGSSRNCRRRRYCKLIPVALLGTALYASGVRADDASASMFSLRGFGTMGTVHSNANYADFTGSFFQPDGAGYSRSWAWGIDSKVGMQMDMQFSDNLSAVAQLVSQHRYDGSYKPQIEWANLKYQFTPDFSIRAGRTVAGPFMLSDARLVGYTYPWIRPPQEVYGVIPLTNMDGIGVSYRHQLGDITNSVNATYGKTTVKIPGGGEIKGKHLFEATNTVDMGSATFRVGYSAYRGMSLSSPVINPLFDGFTQFGSVASGAGFPATGAQAFALRDQYKLADFRYSVVTVGMNYDPGDWMLMAEWATEKTPIAVSDSTAWYVTGGYRFGKFTPYLTLAKLQPDRRIESGIATGGLPGPLATGAAGLNDGLTAVINAFAFSQESVSVGTRWDFMKNTDFKMQYDRILLGPVSGGRLGNIQPGFQPGSAVNVLSLAVDFVF